MNITPIQPDLVGAVWPAVVEMLQPAVDTAKGKCEMTDLLSEILKGSLVLWMVWKGNKPVAFFTTRIIEYPQRRAMALDWVGGREMRTWMKKALDLVEEHARRNGCEHLEGYGRSAWGRLLKRHGWEPEYVAYRMELNNGR